MKQYVTHWVCVCVCVCGHKLKTGLKNPK